MHVCCLELRRACPHLQVRLAASEISGWVVRWRGVGGVGGGVGQRVYAWI